MTSSNRLWFESIFFCWIGRIQLTRLTSLKQCNIYLFLYVYTHFILSFSAVCCLLFFSRVWCASFLICFYFCCWFCSQLLLAKCCARWVSEKVSVLYGIYSFFNFCCSCCCCTLFFSYNSSSDFWIFSLLFVVVVIVFSHYIEWRWWCFLLLLIWYSFFDSGKTTRYMRTFCRWPEIHSNWTNKIGRAQSNKQQQRRRWKKTGHVRVCHPSLNHQHHYRHDHLMVGVIFFSLHWLFLIQCDTHTQAGRQAGRQVHQRSITYLPDDIFKHWHASLCRW